MFKFIRKWLEDYNLAQKELNKMGFVILPHNFGSWFIDCVNNTHDKHRTVQRKDRITKKRR